MKQKLLVLFFLLFTLGLRAQTHFPVRTLSNSQPGEDYSPTEVLYDQWNVALNDVQKQVQASDKDFKVFKNFNWVYLDSERNALMQLVNLKKIDSTNIASYISVKKQTLLALYVKYIGIKKEFPSSVDEAMALPPAYHYVAPTCNAACTNMDFASGKFSGWYGYYGSNGSSTTAYAITYSGGGALGAVTTGATGQLKITKSTQNDWFLSTYSTYTMSQASPWGTGYSAMLGDSVGTGAKVAFLSQAFDVTALTNSITYAYSVFLENPAHNYYQQPFFNVTIFNSLGDTISSCGVYNVVSGTGLPGFKGIYYGPLANHNDTVYWKNWTEVNVPLTAYVGQCVTIQFEAVDCEKGGHFGYAYVDASCSTFTITASAPAICGHGSINLDGPSGEQAYVWTGPAGGILTNPDLQQVTVDDPGTYTCIVTPVTGGSCNDTLHYTVIQDTISVTATPTNIACNGGTGSAAAVESNGTTPFTYAWTPSAKTTATATGLSAGSYTVSVTDKYGCPATASVTITQPAALTAAISSSTNLLCNSAGTGSATVSAGGGTTPYTYSWNPSGQTNAMATGLSAGNYTVTVKDANGCTKTASLTITQPPVLTAVMSVPSNVLCNGAATGSATVTAGGGTAPYTYSWAPNGGSNATGTGLTAGSYTVTVTDNNGCVKTASVNIAQPTPLTATITSTNNILCNGGTGNATVTAGGATSPYNYLWTPNGGVGVTGTGLSAGSYTVTVTDHNGCTATASVTITEPPVLTAAISSSTDLLCNGAGTGSASVSAGGGTTPYTYFWNPSGQTNAMATGLSAGNYTVTVKDADGCTKTVSVTITQPPVLTAVMGVPTNVLCNGGTGSATVTAGGGTAPYTYSWAPNGGAGATGTGLTAGSYTVTVTDNNGCIKTASVTITQPPVLTANMGVPTNVLCNGGTGSATVTAGGGTPLYTYSWAPSGGVGATGTGLTAGNYTVTVKDADGCIATASVTITQPPVLTASMGVPTNVLCNGGTGSATVTAGGGTPLYTYSWAPTGGVGSTGTGLTAGNYTVTVKDADGCIATASVTITQPPILTANMGVPTNILCNGGNNGAATVTAGGGTAPYTYSWAPNGGAGATGTGLTAGSYTVTVTDNNGCIKTASVTITQPAILTANMGVPTNVLCNGGTGSATVTAGGGTVPYTYSWAPSGGVGATGTGLTAGSYTVTVTDNNGCIATASVTITQPPVLTANMGVPTNVLCNGGTGSATVTAGGGTPLYTYSWAPTGGVGSTGTGLTAGNYTVTVKDADGCIATASVTITQPPILTANMGVPTNVLCNGGTGSATVTAGGGTPLYTYSWAPNGGVGSTGTGLTAGSYTVTVKDADGCIATASVTITQPPVLTANMGVPTNVLCNGGTGSATVTAGGGTAPYTYSWAPNGGAGATGTGLTAGSYTVTVTDNNGCIKTASVTITQPPVLTANMGVPTNVLCNGGTGSATVTAGGGTPLYTYSWAPSGGVGATGTGLTAGNYTVTVKDADGCIATASVTITQPPVLTASMGVPTNVLCNGGTGSATVTAGGGTPLYTYSWAPTGGVGSTGTGLTAGNYTVTVKDADGCIATASVTITQPPILTANMGVPTNILCNGGNNGAATVTAGGGTAPYTYSWAPNGGAGATGTGLTAGSYTVTVTDNNGCIKTASVTITQPAILTANMGVPTNVLCNGGTGSATVTAGGGTVPYTYSWAPSGGVGATGTGLTAGSYTVTVTDNNGCIATASVTITQPPVLTANMGVPTNVLCNGGTGSATVTAGGGTPLYTYSWAPTGGVGSTGTGLTAGNYTVTVKDADGCIATASVTITQPPILTANMGVPTNVLCNGGTGSATVTAGGGTPLYTYSWAPNGGVGSTGTGLTAGSYTVTVKDADGCIATASVTITQPTPLGETISSTQASCGLSNGSATVIASGGTVPYTYLWNPSGQNTAIASNLSAGNYTVTITDNNGCIITASIAVTQPTAITANITGNVPVLCNGGNNGSATVIGAGGTMPYTYSWAPNGGAGATGTGLTAGSYTVTVTDNNGCIATASVTITQPPVLTANMGVPTNVLCNGGNNGSATVTAGGGTPLYTYSWAPNGGIGSTGTGLTAGNYTVTVTDADGCMATASVTITQPPVLTANMGVPTNVSCNGGNNGSVTVTAGGGTPLYTYSWAPNGGLGATGTGLTVGSYTVTVKDADGCITTASVTITQPAPLSATTSFTQASCNLSNGNATVNVLGGTVPYTYLWNPSAQNTATASNISAGSYTVTVTDNNGCIITASVTVTQPSAVTANITGNVPVLCNGGNNGSATVTAGGGTAPYTYSWAPNGGAGATGTGLTAGSYTVTVTDNNGCIITASVIITQPPVLTANMGVPIDVLCNGGNNGSVIVTAGGGTPLYTYSWAPNGGIGATGTGLTAGNYTVTVTDADGCMATASVTVTQPTVLTATMGVPTNVLCNGGTGNATVTAGGGTPLYTYSWAPNGGIGANGTALTAGNYTVTVKDADGCIATASVIITQPATLSTTTSFTQASCNLSNGSATVNVLGGTVPYTYLWNPSAQNTATATGLSAGGYTVTVTDNNGCIITASLTVTQPSAVTANITGNVPVLCNGGNNGTITVAAGGGTPLYTYSWAPNGGIGATGTGLTAGNYTVTVTDNNGCTVTASATITQPTVLTATMGVPTNVLCNAGNNGSATVTAGGGTTLYTYSWAPNGGVGATGTGLTAGNYTVTVKDADGCIATASVTITQPTVLIAAMGVPTNILCNGGNNGSATVTAGGGTVAYVYTWAPNGGAGATGTGLTAGNYTVTVKDADGCIATASVTITQPLLLTATMGAPNNVLCNGGTGNATVIMAGGTVPYVYTWAPLGGTNATGTGLVAGFYTVTVKDADGCTATASVTITQPTPLTVNATGPQTSCSGAPITLVANASGGTLPYRYNWAPIAGNTSSIGANPLVSTSYTVTVTDANGCIATSVISVNVNPPLDVFVTGDTVICPGGKVFLKANAFGGDGIYSYLWLPSNLTTQTVVFSPTRDTVLTIEVTDGCGSTMVSKPVNVTVQQYPISSFGGDVLSGCAPLCIQFRDYSSSVGIAQWNWNFGNGDSLSEQSPVFCYKDTGTYSVTLTVISKIGCSGTLKIDNMIHVYPPPKANFIYSPQPVNISDPEVQFTDMSRGRYPIISWNWRFGQGDSTSSLRNPTHYYPDTGTYCPTLTIMDIHGCVDSVTNCFVVNPQFGFYIPDAFTPNGDGINDIFIPKGTYVKAFEMYIFDRWGMKIFHTTDMKHGWDGTVNGGSVIAQEDVYVYKINVTDSEGNLHSYIGRVTLLK